MSLREINGFLIKAGFTPGQVKVTAQKDGYYLHHGSNPPQKFTNVTEVINALNALISGLKSDRNFPLFRLNPFWDQPAWLVDIDGRSETTGSEAESMLLTSLNNDRTWTFDYEDKAFQKNAAREADKIIRQFTFLLSLPDEVIAAITAQVDPASKYPLRERLVEYREALMGLLKDVPRNIAEIHQRIAFSTPEKRDTDVEPLKLAYRLSYRYRNLALFDRDISPEHFARFSSTTVARRDDAKAIALGGVKLHHPASFTLALRPEEKEPAEMKWNLQLLANWLRFLTLRGFEVGLVNDEIVVRLNQVPILKFLLRDNLLVEQWKDSAEGGWQEAVVGEKKEARVFVTHDTNRPWGLATFKLPDGKKLPPMRILSMIPQMGSRDQHPTALEKQANENIARWLGSLIVNLAEWRSTAPSSDQPERNKRSTSDVDTLPSETDGVSRFAKQLEEGTIDWIRQLMEDFRWGRDEVAVLQTQEKNLVIGLQHLLGRDPTPVELKRMLLTEMGFGVAGRWGTFSTKEGVKNILWIKSPDIVAHEAGHDFFAERSIDALIDNQWHSLSLLFPKEEDFLGYYRLVQDYFATKRDFRDGGSGNLPSGNGSLTDIGSGNLAAILTSVHGGMSYVFPSAYALWGDIEPHAERPVIDGQEYAAELWEQEMNKFTLAGVVYHATDPHEEGEVHRILSYYHQRTIQSPFQGSPANPFAREEMLRHDVPMDELRLYQTRAEVLESTDPKVSRRQRLATIAHFAPAILREGLKSIKAVRLIGRHELVLAPDDSPVLDVGGFLLTPEQERVLRSQDYKNFFKSIALAQGKVVKGKEKKPDGQVASVEFHGGQEMDHARWTGGSVSVDPGESPPQPQQQIVRDNRLALPNQWFPFQQEREGIVAKKVNREVGPVAAPAQQQPPPPTKPDKPLAAYQSSSAEEVSGFKPWMLLAAPLAPLYPVFAAWRRSRKQKQDREMTLVPTASQGEVVPWMEASAMLCLDAHRSAGITFAITDTTYEAILPILSEYELYHRYDPEMAFELLMQLYHQGIDPDYLLNCLTFPLGKSLVAEKQYQRAFELNAWAKRMDSSGKYADDIQGGFFDIADRIFENDDKSLFQLGWDALERAMGAEKRPPELVRLTVNYLMWRDGENLKPETLFEIVVGMRPNERKIAAEASMEWTLKQDSAVQVAALRNAWVWLGNPKEFVQDVLQRRRKGFIPNDLLDYFLRALPPAEADLFARQWFESHLRAEEFDLGFSWLETMDFASTETLAYALIQGTWFHEQRYRLKEFVSILPPDKLEALNNELASKNSFYAARAMALFFPDPIEGIDSLIDRFLKNGWPKEYQVKGIERGDYVQFMTTLGIWFWHDLPSMQNYATTLIDRSLEGEGFPINAERYYEFYKYLYEFYAHQPLTYENDANVYFLNTALTEIYFGSASLPGLPELPSLSHYNPDRVRLSRVVATTVLRSRLLELIAKLDRGRAEKLAGLVPASFEAPPDNDPELKVALILNALHEPWDKDFPRNLLEGRHPYTIEIASTKLVRIVRDRRYPEEMRRKAAWILKRWGREGEI